MIVKNGLYSVYDKYFDDFRNDYFCDNKQENRPYYCSFIDKDDSLLKELNTKANKYITLVKYGKLKPTVDILKIKELIQGSF